VFLECHEEASLTEEEMIELVETEVSCPVIESDKEFWSLRGEEAPPYLSNLGFVFGTINEGLTYAR
jgi:hypothetical protein